MRRYLDFPLFFLLITFGTVRGSEQLSQHIKPECHFDRLWLEEGLSQSSVRALHQDSRGFLWIGTEDGLNKYDGYSFKVYKSDSDNPNSLGSNFIRAIHESPAGVLWIGTNGGGLTRFDTSSENFTRYQSANNQPGISNNFVWDIYEDENGILWIGTDGGGLNRFDPGTGQFTDYRYDQSDPQSLSDDEVISVCGSPDGSVWVGTRDGGLNRLNPSSGLFLRYIHNPRDPESVGEGTVWDIYRDQNNVIWIATGGGGLNRYDRGGDRFVRYLNDPSDPYSISSNSVMTVYSDSEGVFWVGTSGGGLNRFDPEYGIFDSYRHNPNKSNSLSYNCVFSILEDNSGILWIGTEIRGLDKLDKNKGYFTNYRYTPDTPGSISHQSVWAVYEDDQGVLWIGTSAGGLNRLNRETGEIEYFEHRPNDENSLGHNHIRAIYEAPSQPGVLWLGTDGGGLNRLDMETGRILRFTNEPGNPKSISGDRVYSIIEDMRGRLWIGTRTGGLNLYDRKTGEFTSYRADPDDPNSICSDFVYVLLEDSDEIIWVGTFSGGLCRFESDSGHFTNFRNIPGDSTSLSNNCVLTIFEDENGILWIGTGGGGLNRFDRYAGSFRSYREEDGLPNGVIYGILSDDEGNLWISTNNGLSRFDPDEEVFRNYSSRDGIQSNEFNGASYYRSESGEMFFGGVDGLTAFHPRSIKENLYQPPVVITDIMVFNRSIYSGSPGSGRQNTARQINESGEIRLERNENFITFEFAALDYTFPDKNRYMYMMEGFDDDWVYTTGKKRFSTYKNLPPGQYEFIVRGTNSDGIWSEDEAAISLIIAPSLAGTWWFRSLAATVLILSLVVYYRSRMKNVRVKTELEAAHEAQMAIMPHEDPSNGFFEIAGICLPAFEVGGDFYDYLWLDKEHEKLGIVIGDVSGKAMKAAMVAVMSNGMVLSGADEFSRPSRFMTKINHTMCIKTEEKMFTALCFGSLGTKNGTFAFSNAGINPPLLKRGSKVSRLTVSGPCLPLGAFDNTIYKDRKIDLEPGDVLVLFTDGITEARDRRGCFYDSGQLRKFLSGLDSRLMTAGQILSSIVQSVSLFSGSRPPEDDMTVIVIKVNGTREVSSQDRLLHLAG